MKIEIRQEETVLEISDENLENDNFVNLRMVFHNEEGAVDARCNNDFSLKELMPALIAFDAKRSRRLSEENN